MPQLAPNWPDKQNQYVRDKSSLIDLEPQASGQQGGTLYEGDRERLSEKTLSVSYRQKRCDSPNPEGLAKAIVLWKQGLTWREICMEVKIPERSLRRYLISMGYKRDYSYVASKLKGRVLTQEWKDKLSATRIEKGVAKGAKNPNWKGGLNNPEVPICNTIEYKLWRTSVFVRDNYTCKGCGIRNKKGLGKTVQFEAHHILPRRDFPHLTFDISNAVTLCKKCHDKTRKKEYLSVNIWKQRVGSL